MEKIHFGLAAIPADSILEVPKNYGLWNQKLLDDVLKVKEEIQYQQRQNIAMNLLHLAAISLAMVHQLGYSASELDWLMDTEEEERRHE